MSALRRTLVLGLGLLVASVAAVWSQTAEPGAGEIAIRGLVKSVDAAGRSMTVDAMGVRLPGEPQETALTAAVAKQVTLSGSTKVSTSTGAQAGLKQVVTGAEVEVVGRNLGRGKALPARLVVIYLQDSTVPTADAAPAKPAAPLAPGAPAAPASAKISGWLTWDDPAGVKFAYPQGWAPSGAVGSNPIVFQQGPLALAVRRVPVPQGSTSQMRVAEARSALVATAGSHAWQTSETPISVGGTNSSLTTVRGKIAPQDMASLLGGKPQPGAEAVQSLVYMIYVPVPENVGRERWALEIGIGGPQTSFDILAEVMDHVSRSVTFARQNLRAAPTYASPLRAANTVQIENTLRQVGTAIQLYLTDNDDQLPSNWEQLRSYLGDSAMLRNLKEGWPQWNVGPVQLLQPGRKLAGLGDPSSAAVGRADGQGFSIFVFADGHVAKQTR